MTELLKLFDSEEHGEIDAWYEPENIGCKCTENGVDSEWEWSESSGCYICFGCGAVQ